ncbi:hypothetical protein M8J76_008775 [Diaphorina citri]|nr:hypothetical protein M8J76_008775 [Diaphorina citri]
MDHLRLSLQAALVLCLLLTIQAESSQEFDYKLPLAAARSVRSEGHKLEADRISPEYHFRYSVRNEDTGDFKSQEESRDGKSVVGRYTVAEPTGHVREVKYTADEKHGFRADVKIHPPGAFQSKNSEKRSADAEEKSDSDEKIEDVQNDKTSDEEKEEHQADETKTSEELLQNDKPQQPEEMTDEEVEKTLEKQEHILNPQEHEHSNTDEVKSADATSSNEQTDNLIITVNAEKKVPVTDTKAELTKQPVHITHAVRDPTSLPAYPFIPHFNSPYPYSHRIPHPAQADAVHHIPHPAIVDHHHQLKTAASLPAPAPVSPPAAIPALLPTFIYHDHPISPVSPLFIQQPSHQAHHYLPGNVQDILAAKQASIQDVENMVRHVSADENKQDERPSPYDYQIHPKPMMFQLADPPVHLLLPSTQFDQSYKQLSYLTQNYPYNVPYYYQPTEEGLGRGALPPHFFDQRNQPNEAQKSILSNLNNFNFIKPIVSNIPPQYLPQQFRPVSSTSAPVNADQVSSTPQPQHQPEPQQQHHQHVEVQVNKGQTPAPPTASSPSHYFNFPFLYPLTTFLQRPFLQHHNSHATPQQTPVQQNQVQQDDAQKVQKPVAQPQPAAAAAPNEQQRYYVIQPNAFPTNGQFRYNPGYPVNTPAPTPATQQKPVAPVKSASLRSQPAHPQVPQPIQSHYAQEKSSNLYSFPYNSPVALLVLPMQSEPSPHNKSNDKGVKHTMDSYYKK